MVLVVVVVLAVDVVFLSVDLAAVFSVISGITVGVIAGVTVGVVLILPKVTAFLAGLEVGVRVLLLSSWLAAIPILSTGF